VTQNQIDDAVAEAERRRSISDRDLSASVQHFGAVVRTVCQEWGLTVERWLPAERARLPWWSGAPTARRPFSRLRSRVRRTMPCG
jgi:hypothetical protein